ncbi:pol polyprotein [Tanacetum coccineum]
MRKRDLNIYSVYHCNQYGDTLFQIALIETKHELNLMRNKREQKYTPPKCESNTDDEDDVWYFDNGASNHMTGNYSYFYELNENNTGRVRFGDGSCVSIKGKGSILFQGKNKEQKLLKYVYYIPALRSNVISLGQATISGYDISIRGDFLTVRDSWGGLLIKVPRSANRLYKAQLKVGKEDTNEVGRESGKDCVEIKQERYAMKILKEACMEECNPALCPMEPGLKLSKAEDEPEVEATNIKKCNHNVDIDDGWITTGHVFYLDTASAVCQEMLALGVIGGKYMIG